MPTTVIHMFGQGTGGTENSVASVDIPFDGSISSIEWALAADTDADGDEIDVELSFISTRQTTTNDARGIISNNLSRFVLVTSGASQVNVNRQQFFEDLRVAGGERLHMHINADAGVTSNVVCNIHLESRTAPRRAQRRR